MFDPLFYILAPVGLAFGLFAVYLVVSIFLKDPVRPFRMFAAPPLEISPESSDQSPEGENADAETRRHGDAEPNDSGLGTRDPGQEEQGERRGAEGVEENDAETGGRGDAEKK